MTRLRLCAVTQIAVFALFLCACGNKGPLYLPADGAAAEPAPVEGGERGDQERGDDDDDEEEGAT